MLYFLKSIFKIAKNTMSSAIRSQRCCNFELKFHFTTRKIWFASCEGTVATLLRPKAPVFEGQLKACNCKALYKNALPPFFQVKMEESRKVTFSMVQQETCKPFLHNIALALSAK